MGKEQPKAKSQEVDSKIKRSYVSQSDFPRCTLAEALSIAKALWENFAGKGARPYDVAMALNTSPTSGAWQHLCGGAIAYGLTGGGSKASEIRLSDLGRRCVAPTKEGDDAKARVAAILLPKIMGEFFRKYDRAKFPKEGIAESVLVEMGLPKDRTSAAVQILRENGIFTGIVRETKTGLFVAVDSPATPPADQEYPEEEETVGASEEPTEEDIARRVSGQIEKPWVSVKSNRVFISHGKNKKILDQLKELLTFGKFEPIVSVDRETTSIAVPDKVFEAMRDCSAAVLHVSQEGELFDADGNKHIRLNENVLIEIGAAIALYKKNFVLLVQRGLELPSNLQGLYRCEYEGSKLDYDATMKLLKTFNQFR